MISRYSREVTRSSSCYPLDNLAAEYASPITAGLITSAMTMCLCDISSLFFIYFLFLFFFGIIHIRNDSMNMAYYILERSRSGSRALRI